MAERPLISVGRRLFVSLAILVACTALIGVSALFGLRTLSHHFRVAESQYAELRALYEVGFQAASLRELLASDVRDDRAVRQRLFAATEAVERLGGREAGAPGRHPSGAVADAHAAILDRLGAVTRLADASLESRELREEVQQWLAEISNSAAATQQEIVENRARASAEFRVTLITLGGLLLVSVSLAVFVGIRQYRSITRPMRQLDLAVRHLADARLDHRVEPVGDREFTELMQHFNRMSAAIEELHASMREQVEMKSRQLVRSEQLASVGFLAAGLAHEINNPLAIITGHTQRLLRRIGPEGAGNQQAEVVKTLRLVCDEAFRCRDIAIQLLELSQQAEGNPRPVEVDALARHAVDLMRPLPICKGIEIECVQDAPGESMVCLGQSSQLLQVFINLLRNALEACSAPGGRVLVRLHTQRGMVCVEVADNGCGMEQAALEHAFDPFFTDKPRRGLSGSGLGLSISHAIIERHQGRIYAQSDGAGRGSRFVVELPALAGPVGAVQSEDAHAASA
jgi:signal transduction histidine kinase